MSSPNYSNSFRQKLKEYFTFTQSELRGTIALVILIALFTGVRWALPFMHQGKLNRLNDVTIQNPDSLIALTSKKLDALDDSLRGNSNQHLNIVEIEIEHSKFAFDPNTVAFPDLLRLGFDKRIANTIVRYRSKGGKFKSENDLLKIYGIDTSLVIELQPYMVLPEGSIASSNVNTQRKPNNYESTTTNDYASTYTAKTKKIVDLNTADSATLVNVNGIGPTFASRIVKLRNRLGGYVSKEQLKDVYGITPEYYEVISPNVTVQPIAIRKININTCTFDELRLHSYFNYKIAKAVIAYRDAHGNFKSIEQLKNVEQIDSAFYNKIEPYVTVN